MKTNFLIHIFEIRDMQYRLTVPLQSYSVLRSNTYTWHSWLKAHDPQQFRTRTTFFSRKRDSGKCNVWNS